MPPCAARWPGTTRTASGEDAPTAGGRRAAPGPHPAAPAAYRKERQMSVLDEIVAGARADMRRRERETGLEVLIHR
ncbi:hypothetical protein ACWGJZ_36580, partial [Streptomyces rimosus]